jgi:hypothetical protein
MFLRQHQRLKDGKEHDTGLWWRPFERRMVRQRTLCYLGELNDSAYARSQKTVEVFNQNGETTQLKLSSSEAEAPHDPRVARVLVKTCNGVQFRTSRYCRLYSRLNTSNLQTVAVPGMGKK